jgi:hypothetical protein
MNVVNLDYAIRITIKSNIATISFRYNQKYTIGIVFLDRVRCFY